MSGHRGCFQVVAGICLVAVSSFGGTCTGGMSPTGVSTMPADNGSQPTTDAGTDATIDSPDVRYVGPGGSDSTNDGSSSRPWRSIQFVIDHIAPSAGVVGTIHVAAGAYDGRLDITRAIRILGAGSSGVSIRNSSMAAAGTSTDYVVNISQAEVTLSGVRIDCSAAAHRGLFADNAAPTLDDVNVDAPGGFGMILHNCNTFSISNCKVGTSNLLFSDVGIDIQNDATAVSTGTIDHLTAGDYIDHIINVGLNCNVSITHCTLRGSTIWWADGVRVQGASTVTISDTTIIRPPGSDTPPAGSVHNPPYAGVEVATSSNGSALVTIQDCTIRGFDVGIGINMVYNRLRVQRCTISDNVSAAVRTVFTGFDASQYPVVDFGGGGLGSTGGNSFGATDPVAFDHQAPYDVAAGSCTWNVPTTSIPGRIHDHADDTSIGTVQY